MSEVTQSSTHSSQSVFPACLKSPSQARTRAKELLLRVPSHPVKHAPESKRFPCVSEVTQPSTQQSQRGTPACPKSPCQARIRAEVLFLRVPSHPVKHAQQSKSCSCVSEVTQPSTHSSQRVAPACPKSPSQARTRAEVLLLRVPSHPVKHAQQPKRYPCVFKSV